jgi:hypothetical protein
MAEAGAGIGCNICGNLLHCAIDFRSGALAEGGKRQSGRPPDKKLIDVLRLHLRFDDQQISELKCPLVSISDKEWAE